MSILELSALELGKKIRKKEISAVEAAEAVLKQIKEKEPVIHASESTGLVGRPA